MNQDCYSDQAAVPMINALDNCRAELEKLKAGAKKIAEALVIADDILTEEFGGDSRRDKAIAIARELGLLEEKK